MIHLANVEKFYQTGPSRTWVLRQIDLAIGEGEFVTVMGPSGAGKSTLLGILGMLDAGWTGSYEFLGHPVYHLKPKQRSELNRHHIGFVFQQYHLIDDLTVYENIETPLSYRDFPKAERQAMVSDLPLHVALPIRMKHYPSQLSGGQQQLVG